MSGARTTEMCIRRSIGVGGLWKARGTFYITGKTAKIYRSLRAKPNSGFFRVHAIVIQQQTILSNILQIYHFYRILHHLQGSLLQTYRTTYPNESPIYFCRHILGNQGQVQGVLCHPFFHRITYSS